MNPKLARGKFETIRSLITMLGEQHENWVNMSIAIQAARKSLKALCPKLNKSSSVVG